MKNYSLNSGVTSLVCLLFQVKMFICWITNLSFVILSSRYTINRYAWGSVHSVFACSHMFTGAIWSMQKWWWWIPAPLRKEVDDKIDIMLTWCLSGIMSESCFVGFYFQICAEKYCKFTITLKKEESYKKI